jgi:hypothetical protein
MESGPASLGGGANGEDMPRPLTNFFYRDAARLSRLFFLKIFGRGTAPSICYVAAMIDDLWTRPLMRSALPFLCAAVIALAGCGQPQHRNTAHPEYGQAEFSRDQDECQRENSRVVTQVTGYSETKHTVVDEDKAQACMVARGW